ncbi:MAG: hypothetical protein JXR53_03750 [Bacteroidales bacterium]|nr:hypothetical protein [Bacteroidales bacterium]
MRRTLTILVLAIFVLPATGQINIGKMKDKAQEVTGTGKTPTQSGAENDAKNKECQEMKENLQEKIEISQNFINQGDLESAETYMKSAKGYVLRIKEEGCTINISKEEADLNQLEADYNSKAGGVAESEETKEAEFEKVKQAVWSLDPLKNQINFGHIGMMKKLSEAELFYQNAKDIDFINKVSDINAIAKKYPDEFQPDYEMEGYLKDFTEKFPSWLAEQKDYLKNEINNAMMEGNNLKARHINFLGEAMDMANAALITADACLILFPGNEEFYKLRETAFSNYQKISQEFSAANYTSDLHAKNAGKIVFSTNPIQMGSENEGAFKNAFNSSETVYGMMYLKTNLSAVQGTGFITTKVFANGTQIADHDWKAAADQQKNTYNEFEIMPAPASAQTYGALKFYEAFSSKLLSGSNTIKVQLLDDDQNVVAEGEFTLDCSGGTDNITARYKELKNIRLEKVRMPQAKINDPALEASMVAAMPAQNWPETAMRAVITGDGWITHRGIMGEILFREMYAAVAFKTPEGTCKIFYMSFKQDYNGSGYGKTQYYSVGGSEEIKCENVNR